MNSIRRQLERVARRTWLPVGPSKQVLTIPVTLITVRWLCFHRQAVLLASTGFPGNLTVSPPRPRGLETGFRPIPEPIRISSRITRFTQRGRPGREPGRRSARAECFWYRAAASSPGLRPSSRSSPIGEDRLYLKPDSIIKTHPHLVCELHP